MKAFLSGLALACILALAAWGALELKSETSAALFSGGYTRL